MYHPSPPPGPGSPPGPPIPPTSNMLPFNGSQQSSSMSMSPGMSVPANGFMPPRLPPGPAMPPTYQPQPQPQPGHSAMTNGYIPPSNYPIAFQQQGYRNMPQSPPSQLPPHQQAMYHPPHSPRPPGPPIPPTPNMMPINGPQQPMSMPPGMNVPAKGFMPLSGPVMPPVCQPQPQSQPGHSAMLNGYIPPSNYPTSFPQGYQNMGYGPGQQAQNAAIRPYIDLIQERNILRYGLDDEEVQLPATVANPSAVSGSSALFRCTFGAVPQNQELLNKSRLPFGLTLQPFRDMKNLSVVNTGNIVRCRYCRTYINPFVYLPDQRHWKCNLCFRLNELPDDFSWDPVSKSYGDPLRRPEMKNSTIEFIAPSEYMLRPPQPAVYVFILDVCSNAVESGYLHIFSEQMLINLDHMPGDERTLIAFIAIDSSVHFFQFYNDRLPPRQMVVDDVNEIFSPTNYGLLVPLKTHREAIRNFIQSLPSLYEKASSGHCALGAALQAAQSLIAEIGGRITVLLTALPDIGPGSLSSRENPNDRAAEDIRNLSPVTDFYKRFALECTGQQVAIDLFLLNAKYADLSSLADVSKFSAGCIYQFPNFHINSEQIEVKRFQKTFCRYLTRKIGFEAVLRIRCTRGLSLHTFHGNFFVRSTDLLAMPNVNPDYALGVQLQLDEPLTGMQTVCFQAALLYTSSKGDRRIRVHTLCLPVATELTTLFKYFDVKCAVSLLAKMAAERSLNGNIVDAREALINAAVDALASYNRSLGQSGGGGVSSPAILSPLTSLRLLPLYVLGLLKHAAFVAGRSVKLDQRVAALLSFKTSPLEIILLEIYPALYALHTILDQAEDPPRLQLSAAFIDRNGVYLMDTGSALLLYVGSAVDSTTCQQLFGVSSFGHVDEDVPLQSLDNEKSQRVHTFIRSVSVNRPVYAPIIICREDGVFRDQFIRRLIEDRTESSHSYVEFLQHIRQEMNR